MTHISARAHLRILEVDAVKSVGFVLREASWEITTAGVLGGALLLAGDIGGTKTDLAVYSSETGPYAPLAETEVHSADYGSLTARALHVSRFQKAKNRSHVAFAGVEKYALSPLI